MKAQMIVVVPDGDKYKVLVNFIQQGISYSSKVLADKEAEKIRGMLASAMKPSQKAKGE